MCVPYLNVLSLCMADASRTLPSTSTPMRTTSSTMKGASTLFSRVRHQQSSVWMTRDYCLVPSWQTYPTATMVWQYTTRTAVAFRRSMPYAHSRKLCHFAYRHWTGQDHHGQKAPFSNFPGLSSWIPVEVVIFLQSYLANICTGLECFSTTSLLSNRSSRPGNRKE